MERKGFPKIAMADKIAAVRKHAREHYNEHGWDIVVEAWDDTQIAALLRLSRTINGAIRTVGAEAKMVDDHRKDIQGTAW